MNLEKELLNYLKSNDVFLNVKVDDRYFNFVKVPYNKKIDLLYMTYNYNHFITSNDTLEYCGFYDKENKKLYDINDYLKRNVLGYNYYDEPYPSMDKLNDELNDKVNECITDYVLKNKKDFYESANGYTPNIWPSDVAKKFVENYKNIEYKADYEFNSNINVLEYITNRDDYVYNKAFEIYTNENQKAKIGRKLYDIDKENELLASIWNDKDNSLHKIRDIRNKLINSNYGQIHVYICKNGLNFDFKYNANLLIDECWKDYGLTVYGLSVQKRKEFENLFGKNSKYRYNDITKIEYRNNPIYIDKNFKENVKDEDSEKIEIDNQNEEEELVL